MRRAFYGCSGGLLLGLVLGLGCQRVTGPDGFALRAPFVALGYGAALFLGAALGLSLLRLPGPRRALLGAAVALLATYVARGLPLPWINLVAFDGGSGPAGEVPLFVLPALGTALGLAFAIDGSRGPSRGSASSG
jgi:hypothetical protein